VSIDLNFSLDGLANTHDAIRGVPNNFKKTLATMEEAERRYRGVRRLRRNVLTVITRENYNEIVGLGLHLMENSRIDGQYFEVVRGAAPDASLKILTREGVAALHRRLMPFHRHYADKLLQVVRASGTGGTAFREDVLFGEFAVSFRFARAVPGIAEEVADGLYGGGDIYRDRPQRAVSRVRDAGDCGEPV
jgi:MoaA/NifB/PqqE/SkfB family radical SAM enzyme